MLKKGCAVILTNRITTGYALGSIGVYQGRHDDKSYIILFGTATQYLYREEFELLEDYNLSLTQKIDRKIKHIYARQHRKTGYAFLL
jgi:hypothetical protein